MTLLVKDIMNTDIISVSPELGLDALEAELAQHAISGAPVMEDGLVLGVVSRSDIIRQLNIEHTFAESTFDYYEGPFLVHDSEEEITRTGAMVGYRMEHLTVKDIMSHTIKSVPSDMPIAVAARELLKLKVHRLLVIDDGLVGILSSSDFVRMCAEQT